MKNRDLSSFKNHDLLIGDCDHSQGVKGLVIPFKLGLLVRSEQLLSSRDFLPLRHQRKASNFSISRNIIDIYRYNVWTV